MRKIILLVLLLSLLPCYGLAEYAQTNQDAHAIVEASFNYMREKTSVSTIDMLIYRPDWKRKMRIKAWTKGQDQSIFWIIMPPRDKGNGTLKKNREMWIYNPKVNRVIKLPPSMMSQAWMGSDFSNDDLSRTNSLLTDYIHTIIGVESHEEKKVYIIKSMPKPKAPVVWGMQKLKIREDHIFLEQEFFDEDFQSVKILTTKKIRMMGKKLFPSVWKMQKHAVEDEYTILEYKKLLFNIDVPGNLFSLSSLKIPRR